MTDDINRLREAIRICVEDIGVFEGEYFISYHEGKAAEKCVEAAKTLLTLYDLHAPEAVRSLIEGKSWIAPNDLTDKMMDNADKALRGMAVMGEERFVALKVAYSAMRNAATSGAEG